MKSIILFCVLFTMYSIISCDCPDKIYKCLDINGRITGYVCSGTCWTSKWTCELCDLAWVTEKCIDKGIQKGRKIMETTTSVQMVWDSKCRA